MKVKKLLSILLLFALVITNLNVGDVYASTDKKPILQIQKTEIPEARAGDEITIPVLIKNNSVFHAKDIVVTPVFDEEDNPFVIEEVSNTKVISAINANNSEKIEFNFRLNENAKKKTYPLKLKFSYRNVHNQEFADEIKTVYVRVSEEHIPPRVVVNKVDLSSETVIAGEDVTADIYLRNTGTLEAKDISVVATENENIAIADNINEKYLLKLVAGDTQKVQFKLRPNKNLETNTYKVNLKIKYLDNNGEKVEKDQVIYIPVTSKDGDSAESNLLIENITAPKEVNAEQKFNVNLDVINKGEGIAKNVKVSVSSDNEGIFPVSQSKFVLGDMDVNQKKPLQFAFSSTSEVKTQNYPIKIILEYDEENDGKTNTQSIEQYAGVLIKAKDTASIAGSVPKVIINSYKATPTIANAGENFDLFMQFQNTSKTKSVRNMKITIRAKENSDKTGESVFSPVNCSNTFYVEELDPGATVDKTMTMYTIPVAEARQYTLETVFEYEYVDSKEIKQNEMTDEIGIHVIQPAKLQIGSIEIPSEITVNDQQYVEVQFYNTGKVALSNLMVKTQGDFKVKDGEYFVGNFEMGNGDYYEPTIIADSPGEKKGKVIFTFEDPTGAEQTLEKEFTINAVEPPEENFDEMAGGKGMPGGEFPGENQENKSNTKLYIIIGVVAAAVLVTIIIIVKKRKKKKGMTFDEDI